MYSLKLLVPEHVRPGQIYLGWNGLSAFDALTPQGALNGQKLLGSGPIVEKSEKGFTYTDTLVTPPVTRFVPWPWNIRLQTSGAHFNTRQRSLEPDDAYVELMCGTILEEQRDGTQLHETRLLPAGLLEGLLRTVTQAGIPVSVGA